MTTTIEDGGRQNLYAKEPQMYIDPEVAKRMENNVYQTHNEKAEVLNGRFAMIGFVAAVVSYLTTGKLFFGVF